MHSTKNAMVKKLHTSVTSLCTSLRSSEASRIPKSELNLMTNQMIETVKMCMVNNVAPTVENSINHCTSLLLSSIKNLHIEKATQAISLIRSDLSLVSEAALTKERDLKIRHLLSYVNYLAEIGRIEDVINIVVIWGMADLVVDSHASR